MEQRVDTKVIVGVKEGNNKQDLVSIFLDADLTIIDELWRKTGENYQDTLTILAALVNR